MAIRSMAAEVERRAAFVPVLIVDAANTEGTGYADLTMGFLEKMELMVPFVFDNYGQDTGNPYSTFGEVRYCHEKKLSCLPLKLYSTKKWPPLPPDHDGGRRGAAQNGYFFGTDLLYKEFPIHNEAELFASKTAMADCIIDRYLQMHPELRWQDDRQTQDALARPCLPQAGGGSFAVGQYVQYYSQTDGWIPAIVDKVWVDGTFEISIRPGQHIPAQRLKVWGDGNFEQNGCPGFAVNTMMDGGTLSAKPFKEGDLVEYVSSVGSATVGKVLAVDVDGCYLDINPNIKVPFASIRPRKHEAFKAGDAVLYNSATYGGWIETKVLHVMGNGLYEIEAKPGHHVSREALKSVQSPGGPTSPQSPASPKKFAVGQQVMYMVEDRGRGAWVASPTVILAAHDDGTFEVEAAKGARVAANLLWAEQSPAVAH